MGKKEPKLWHRFIMDVKNGDSSRYLCHLFSTLMDSDIFVTLSVQNTCIPFLFLPYEFFVGLYSTYQSLYIVLQLINHGIPEELLERVKKVCSEFYKLEREENFKNSKTVKLLNELAEKKSSEKVEHADWEDVITLLDDNEWPENTPDFRYKPDQQFYIIKYSRHRIGKKMIFHIRKNTT